VTLNKSARYALYASLEMALADPGPATVAGIAGRYGIPPTALAKVLQQLVRSGIAVGSRGVGGGYRLARPATRISVLDVVSTFDPPRPPGRCTALDTGARCDRHDACSVRGLFDEVDELVRNTFASVTIETLATRRRRRI